MVVAELIGSLHVTSELEKVPPRKGTDTKLLSVIALHFLSELVVGYTSVNQAFVRACCTADSSAPAGVRCTPVLSRLISALGSVEKRSIEASSAAKALLALCTEQLGRRAFVAETITALNEATASSLPLPSPRLHALAGLVRLVLSSSKPAVSAELASQLVADRAPQLLASVLSKANMNLPEAPTRTLPLVNLSEVLARSACAAPQAAVPARGLPAGVPDLLQGL
jgi:hypothetical protein